VTEQNLPPEIREIIEALASGEGFAQAWNEGDAYDPPPDLRGATIDFSMMHLMDHSVWLCHGPGGRRHHLRLRWMITTKPWIRAHTLCLLGFHHGTTMFKLENHVPTWAQKRCVVCHKALGAIQPI